MAKKKKITLESVGSSSASDPGLPGWARIEVPTFEIKAFRVATKEQLDLEELIESMLGLIGEDSAREGLQETPRRVAEAWLNELVSGYRQDPADVLKTFESTSKSEMVVVRDVPVYSLCEHHMLPFFGIAHFAYIPDKRILGLSKFARLTDVFARRLQVQERLTTEIIDAFDVGLEPKAAMIIIEAEHMCMRLRGVQVAGSKTVTSAIRGLFRDVPAAREEAMRLIYGR